MIIVLKPNISAKQRQQLEQFLQSHKLQVHEIAGMGQSVLGIIGVPSIQAEELAALPSVGQVVPISKSYKRASREWQRADSIYQIGLGNLGNYGAQPSQGLNLIIGGRRLNLIVELPSELLSGLFLASDDHAARAPELGSSTEEGLAGLQSQLEAFVQAFTKLRTVGASILSYQLSSALGRKSLQFIQQLKQQVGMPLLLKVSSLSSLQWLTEQAELADCAEMLQVAASQMRNTELLAELARIGKPLILERLADASLEEFLLAAEFLLSQGLKELVLAETFMPNPAQSQSPMLDLANIHLLQRLSHLPVFVSLANPFGSLFVDSQAGQPSGDDKNHDRAKSFFDRSLKKEFRAAVRHNSQLSSLALAAAAAGAHGIEFALDPVSLLSQFLPLDSGVRLANSQTGASFDCLSSLASGKCQVDKQADGQAEFRAEWDEALYLQEQLEQMAALLQCEIVRLPALAGNPVVAFTAVTAALKEPLQESLKVAFQGEPGAYSEQALRQFFEAKNADAIYPRELFGNWESVPCVSFRRMFEAVQNSEVAFAVVPLENSLAGSIMENYDLLLEYPDLCICGETRLRVSHMLIVPKSTAASKGSRLSDIEIVRSHPQALAQSSRFLEQHGLRPVANFDTAGSVRELKDCPEPHVAAIASSLAADIYNMEILARAIENNPHNYTRFAIVTRSDSALLRPKIEAYEQQSGRRFGNKWSLCLRLRNFSGSLATALGIFEKYQLDLTKLESRPIMGQPWSYRFYLDTLLAPDINTELQETEFFGELERISEEYRVIGRYWQNLK